MAKTMAQPARAKESRAEATRRRLLASARQLFGANGFNGTSVDEVVRAAGVTKGALYHHFADKDALFRAVVEEVKADVTTTAANAFFAADVGDDQLERLHVVCQEMIDAHLDPAVQRITVVDARAVLDARTRRDVDTRYEVAALRGALRSAMRAGAIERQELGPLAHLIASAIFEACALIVEAPDPSSARTEVAAVLNRLLDGLQPRVAPTDP